MLTVPLPVNVDAVVALLEQHDYFSDRRLATSVFLALKLRRPLFLEGEAGVGKTEIAKVLASALSRSLVRLQCYEGLDTASAVYEWNYPRQMIEIRLAEAQGKVDKDALASDIFAERFLIRRPLLQALKPADGIAPVLLIDELDRTDEPFEAYLLEVLAEYQITIPELGAVKGDEPPIVVITSNRTREIHDAIKRRCLYHWVDYPDAKRELAIVRRKVPGADVRLANEGRASRNVSPCHGPVQVARSRETPRLGRSPRRARPQLPPRSGDGLQHAGRAVEVLQDDIGAIVAGSRDAPGRRGVRKPWRCA
jgi:MoxR-like ATPase